MSRPSMMPSRNLSLTEELERLEQSITLTLQEIDHNFSRAHRIVTSSIIPIVEQYAKHSDAVWEGSKFWKQFFEASANVSLSGYEEAADNEEDMTLDETQTTAGGTVRDASGVDESVSTPGERPTSRYSQEIGDDFLLDSPSVNVAAAQQTPRRQQQQRTSSTSTGKTPAKQTADPGETSFAEYPSPYETLRKEMEGEAKGKSKPSNSSNSHPTTPGAAATTTPGGGPNTPFAPSTQRNTARRADNPDPILHRVLDKNYRVQATPHYTGGKKQAAKPPPPALLDSSPFSPAIAPPPQLRSEFFGTPTATRRPQIPAAPRTPGVSVQAPRRTPRALFGEEEAEMEIDFGSDDDTTDNLTRFSPPKTMQFHVPSGPQQRLLQTPAQEASRRIVAELLMSAGVPPGTGTSTLEDVGGGMGMMEEEEASPSVVRVAKGSGFGAGAEDTF